MSNAVASEVLVAGLRTEFADTYLKIKVHRGRPTEALTLDVALEDEAGDLSPGARDFYYVRLVQRNGQRAWSSPIWVQG